MTRASEAAAHAAASEAAPEPEGRVLEALDQGDRRTALNLLMTAYGTMIYRFCRQLVGDAELADDVHQMTFVQAYESLGRFQRRSSLRTWLFSIARHRGLDALKAARRRRLRFEPTAELPELPVDEKSAADRLADRGRRRALERCLGELRPEVRTAVVLRFQEDLSYPQIARIVGDRPPALQARVTRAMPVLRRCLEAGGQAW